MCFGGSSAPPAPIPAPSPRPPRVTNTQASAASATDTTGRSRSASENVENVRKGRKVLRIPLISGAGSGVQITN